MRIDLHTHSSASDGTQPPAELVRAGAEAGLDVMAITDHDSTAGWDEAAVAAQRYGVTLVRGIEISTIYRRHGVHLLAYLPSPDDVPLAEELARVVQGREDRVPRMLAKLRALGIPATEEALAEITTDTVATGRPHVADLLVRLGVVADRGEAFDRFLRPGMPAFVSRYATDLVAMIGLVTAAGGVPVVAHPWGRGSAGVLDREALAELADAGLFGLEVDHLDHDAEQRGALRDIAAELGLVVTGSSDHHGLGKLDHDLGCETTSRESYQAIVARAAELGSPTAVVGAA